MDSLAVLQKLGSGRFIDEVVDAVAKTADEVVATGKAGSVTVTLKISNSGVGDALVVIADQIARRSPKKDPRAAFLYSVDGTLHREDPRQTVMEFRTVEGGAPEFRSVEDRGHAVREAL